MKNSLHISDLAPSISKPDLIKFFKENNINLENDNIELRNNKKYSFGFIHFINNEEAANALSKLNHRPINGKPCNLNWNVPNYKKREHKFNLFVKGLNTNTPSSFLHDHFGDFGSVFSSKIPLNLDGTNKKYGFVEFENEEGMNAALNSSGEIGGMKLEINRYIPKNQRKEYFTNVYVKNFDESVNEENLREKFSEIGKVTSVKIEKDPEGKSRCFGYVNFSSLEEAQKAIEKFNDVEWNTKVLYVARHKNKDKRLQEKNKIKEERRNEVIKKYQGTNLYIKNIPTEYKKEELEELFKQYGKIRSSMIAFDSEGKSKGFGFVAFETKEEAQKAMKEQNEKMIDGQTKPLQVMLALKRDERQNILKSVRQPNTNMPIHPPPYGYPYISQYPPPYAYSMRPGFPGMFPSFPNPGYPTSTMKNPSFSKNTRKYTNPNQSVNPNPVTKPKPKPEEPVENKAQNEEDKQKLGQEIYDYLNNSDNQAQYGDLSTRLTGIIIASLPLEEIKQCVENKPVILMGRVREAFELIKNEIQETRIN